MHASEPLLRVEGRRLVCQLVESMVLNLINFQTLIASKAARVVEAPRAGRWSTSASAGRTAARPG